MVSPAVGKYFFSESATVVPRHGGGSQCLPLRGESHVVGGLRKPGHWHYRTRPRDCESVDKAVANNVANHGAENAVAAPFFARTGRPSSFGPVADDRHTHLKVVAGPADTRHVSVSCTPATNMTEMTILSDALAILRALEAHLIDRVESPWRLIAALQRYVYFPLRFLWLGVRAKLSVVSLWGLLNGGLFMASVWIVHWLGLDNQMLAQGIPFLCTLAALVMVVFSLPSTYGAGEISDDTVLFVVRHLGARELASDADVETLKKTIRPFEERARARIVAMKWLTGLIVAWFNYSWGKALNATPDSVLSAVGVVVGLACVSMVAYLLVWGYEAAVNKLFQAIELGGNEYCRRLRTPQRPSA